MGDELRRHVILGAGPLGRAIARRTAARGEPTVLVSRRGADGAPAGVETVRADVRDPEDAARACTGADVVYLCVGGPYPLWPELLPAVTDGALVGAETCGARLIYGDNLYAYGPSDEPLREDTPRRPIGPKGRLRKRLTDVLMEAHAAGRVPVAVARASDFYGPDVENAIVGAPTFRAVRDSGTVMAIGSVDQPHSFCYIDDFAEAMVLLGERDEALGRVWHVPHAPPITIREFCERIARRTGTTLQFRVGGPLALTVLGWFNPEMRELREVLYQFDRPFVVDDARFRTTFDLAPTPLDQGIEQTLAWLSEEDADA